MEVSWSICIGNDSLLGDFQMKNPSLMMAALLAATGLPMHRDVYHRHEDILDVQSDTDANEALRKAQEKRDRKAAKRVKNARS